MAQSEIDAQIAKLQKTGDVMASAGLPYVTKEAAILHAMTAQASTKATTAAAPVIQVPLTA
jgi:hypothetical protein